MNKVLLKCSTAPMVLLHKLDFAHGAEERYACLITLQGFLIWVKQSKGTQLKTNTWLIFIMLSEFMNWFVKSVYKSPLRHLFMVLWKIIPKFIKFGQASRPPALDIISIK